MTAMVLFLFSPFQLNSFASGSKVGYPHFNAPFQLKTPSFQPFIMSVGMWVTHIKQLYHYVSLSYSLVLLRPFVKLGMHHNQRSLLSVFGPLTSLLPCSQIPLE